MSDSLHTSKTLTEQTSYLSNQSRSSLDSSILFDSTVSHSLPGSQADMLHDLEHQSSSSINLNDSRIRDHRNSSNIDGSADSTVSSQFPTNSIPPTHKNIRSLSQYRLSVMNRIRRSDSDQISLNYRGINIYDAARQGNYPVFVLLWGIASSRYINIMVPDGNGNTPLHHASMSQPITAVGTCDVSAIFEFYD